MFSKGSRYRNLDETVFLNAKGERFQGKVLRRKGRGPDPLSSASESRFLHTVMAGDRLDLLGYKYYSDSKRWWLISDTNPEWPFPLDMLDQRPIVEEGFVLRHLGFEKRFDDLLIALRNLGEVRSDSISFFDVNTPFEVRENLEPSFLEETILVIYPPASRTSVLNAFQAQGFHRLRSFGFPQGPLFAESFTVDDPAAKLSWHVLLDALRASPGVIEVQSELIEATLNIAYNSAAMSRESLLSLMSIQGFDFDSIPSSRVGKKIRIPPNQFV
jgi:hypothetical protein